MLEPEYRQFNYDIYEEYFSQNLRTFSNVASILAEIEKISENENYSHALDYLRSETWNKLLNGAPNDPPKYLGLIAIQLLVAFRRHEDEQWTANAFNPRLAEEFKLSGNQLQAKYNNGQHEIYTAFENWCREKGLSIYLSHNNFARCHVQYPLSLSLFKKDDLDSLGDFFNNCNLACGDEIEFDLFAKIIDNRLNDLRSWRKIQNGINDDPELKKVFLKQVYDAFRRWDGMFSNKLVICRSANKKRIKEYFMYWCGNSDEKPEFYCDEEAEEFSNIDHCLNGCFFIQDEINWNDWNYISKIRNGINDKTQYAFVCVESNEVSNFLLNSNLQPNQYGSLNVFKLTSNIIDNLKTKFPSRFGSKLSVRLVGGCKIEHRKWLKGLGPRIEVDNDDISTILLQKIGNQSIMRTLNVSDQSLIGLDVGRYFLKYYEDAPFIHFEIAISEEENNVGKNGWHISEEGKMNIADNSDDIHITGLDFSGIKSLLISQESELINSNTNRVWMNLASEQEIIPTGNNIVHQVIRRAINGICNRKNIIC